MDITSKKIIPYFQPIIAADMNGIYAFEVLGRYADDDGAVKSLGTFFSDKTVSCEDVLRVDRIIRKQALKQYAEEGTGQYLFINMRLEWIANYTDMPEELPTIMWAKEFGVDFNRLVIEITEEEFNTNNDAFTKVVNYYKNMGCRIAIDDFGKNSSNIERLALLSPDIIKIDMSYVHKSEESYHYREYLKTITSFAERVGIEVLYEGIETQKQLDICIGSKGRYYQGFLLAMPQSSIVNATIDYSVFLSSYCRSVTSLHKRSDRVNERRKYWDMRIEQFFSKKKFSLQNDINDYFSELCFELSNQIKRIYLCNRYGEQLSYNIEMDSGKIIWTDYRHRNWAWRGYFQKAMIMFGSGIKSYLTDVYRDVITKEKIYTYIYLIDKDKYLFIDILLHLNG